MSSFNDITGQQMKTKAATDQYRDGWDKIFGKKKAEQPPVDVENVEADYTDRPADTVNDVAAHIPKDEQE